MLESVSTIGTKAKRANEFGIFGAGAKLGN